jgi:hypothetical protein
MYQNQVQKEVAAITQLPAKNKQYLLIYSCDRTFSLPKIFDSIEEAIAVMLNEVGASLQLTPSKLMEPEERAKEDPLKQFDIVPRKAWVDRRSQHNWQIFEVTIENNQITKCE